MVGYVQMVVLADSGDEHYESVVQYGRRKLVIIYDVHDEVDQLEEIRAKRDGERQAQSEDDS